tara:strand:+ start:302 stop:499 length:198 start_codon:yes stop_codon:yes gene_type:complete
MEKNFSKKFLRLKEVIKLTSLSKSTIYRQIAKNNFPRQIFIGSKIVVWLENDIEIWMNNLVKESR